MKKYYYKLNIDHKWLIWEPLKGPYKFKKKYICATSIPEDKFLGKPVIISGYTKNGKLHMHLGSATVYQFQNNTTLLTDQELIDKLEKKFKEYKKTWETKRIAKVAKRLLQGVYK